MRLFYTPVGARYINRQVLAIFLVALSVLLSVALGDRLIEFLQKAAAGNIPADRVFYIVLLRMPELIQVVLPFALYIGLLMGLGRLYSSQEMSVLRSAGLHTNTLLMWLMPIILLVSLVVGIASISLTPKAKFALEQELMQLQKRIGLSLLQPGIFRIENGGEQVTYSNALADDGQTILDVFIQRQMADGRQMTVWAEQGRRSQADPQGRQTLTLKNGRRYVGSPGSAGFATMSFAELQISIESAPVLEQVRDIEALATSDLLAVPAHQAEWHWRFGLPIFCLVLALLAVAKSTVQPRQGQYARVGSGMLWMLGYYLLLLLNRWLIETAALPHQLGLWPVHLILAACAAKGLRDLGLPAAR
ncbi:MAG: LPS export ABC transporter permease LptF [Proteobacteria bacterium]|nr:LPS export ABC transporter permease LptF [Pseudomonadota bacterium]